MIARNLEEIRSRLAAACRGCGREPDEVLIVAVGKTHPIEKIREAAAAGQKHFGENRIQEARAKIPESPAGLCWHMVGSLQKNKVKYAVKLFDWIHSVDSLELARIIDNRMALLGKKMNVLVEVKLSPEASKFGVPLEMVEDLVGSMMTLKNVNTRGLMTMPPLDLDPAFSRPYFRKLSELAREVRDRLGLEGFDELSMGMSHDFEVAVEEGATMVRIGTAIFGARETWNE